MSDSARCETCRFFSSLYPNGGHMVCRWRPPVMVTVTADAIVNSYWPQVAEHDWCGEYEAREVSDAQS